MKNKKNKKMLVKKFLLSLAFLFFVLSFVSAAPEGPSIVSIENETASVSPSAVINVSGGYISTINLSAKVQNPRWKGMVGWLNGKFALSDASGSTLFDWSTVITGGKVYATHNSSTVLWSQIKCANTTILEKENLKLNHTRFDDNVTATFSDISHRGFFVGTVPISANSCPTLNTYINSAP
ncbi:MAG: hypothetical protein QXO70_03825, partial [Candidatus Pacearchaeota archaeon]